MAVTLVRHDTVSGIDVENRAPGLDVCIGDQFAHINGIGSARTCDWLETGSRLQLPFPGC